MSAVSVEQWLKTHKVQEIEGIVAGLDALASRCEQLIPGIEMEIVLNRHGICMVQMFRQGESQAFWQEGGTSFKEVFIEALADAEVEASRD